MCVCVFVYSCLFSCPYVGRSIRAHHFPVPGPSFSSNISDYLPKSWLSHKQSTLSLSLSRSLSTRFALSLSSHLFISLSLSLIPTLSLSLSILPFSNSLFVVFVYFVAWILLLVPFDNIVDWSRRGRDDTTKMTVEAVQKTYKKTVLDENYLKPDCKTNSEDLLNKTFFFFNVLPFYILVRFFSIHIYWQ